MNNLKTARRSRMGTNLLRILMTICSLGDEWSDPTKIPVNEIVEEWRSRSSRGRYEHAMWKAAGLEEPKGRWQQQQGGGVGWVGDEDGARPFEGLGPICHHGALAGVDLLRGHRRFEAGK